LSYGRTRNQGLACPTVAKIDLPSSPDSRLWAEKPAFLDAGPRTSNPRHTNTKSIAQTSRFSP